MTTRADIVTRFERAILDGQIDPGERLPTVRELSAEYGVSAATISGAYQTLQRRGLVNSFVGRGTFAVDENGDSLRRSRSSALSQSQVWRSDSSMRGNWRRRAVSSTSARLVARYPMALDCTSGKPDTSLLPMEQLKDAWRQAIETTDHSDLQYAGPEPVADLDRVIRQIWTNNGLRVEGKHLVIGSSAQQLILLVLSVISQIRENANPTILVEEPGFQTVFDAMERFGANLRGVALDDFGMKPDLLEQALARGNVDAVLFTPRGHNPTGRSWSPSRRSAIADVLANYPNVIVLEDDQIAEISITNPGSLSNDPRFSDRVIYIRSFSKSIAPDLRLAAAMAAPTLAGMLMEAKSFSDGWSSRLAQRALAILLTNPDFESHMKSAQSVYEYRRKAIITVLDRRLGDIGFKAESRDGMNIWISLPSGFDASDIVERAAAAGVLVVSGEPFFLYPGNDSCIRMSVSQLGGNDAIEAAERFAEACLNLGTRTPSMIPI